MDDSGHLFLSARGGVEYAGSARHTWYDEAHRSVLVLSPRSRKLRQITLDTSLDVESQPSDRHSARARRHSSKSACVKHAAQVLDHSSSSSDDSNDESDDNDDDADKENTAHCGVTTLFDFVATTQHGEGGGSNSDRARSGRIEPVVLVRLSLDRQYIAVQTSDIEVQVVRLATREKFWIMCKPTAGNRILHDGVVWNTHSSAPESSQDLFLVTKMGIEHYRVSPKRRNCALHKALGVYIHSFWYAPSHGVLIVSTGSRANEIVPYALHGASVEKLPRLVFSSSVGQRDLFLAPLYGQLFAVYGDTRASKLLLYLVERNRVSCVRALELMLPPGTALEYSVVDNLLACHSLDFSVSLFFDIRSDDALSREPFSHPLPISLRAPLVTARSSQSRQHVSLVSPSSSLSEELPTHDLESDLDALDSASVAVSVPSVYDATSQHHIRRAHSVDDMHVHHAILDADALNQLSANEDADDDADAGSYSGNTPSLPQRHTRRLERAMTARTLGKMNHHHDVGADDHYFSRWRFLSPNLVQRSFSAKGSVDSVEHVEVRKLQVNLRGVCRSCARHRDVLPFLLRRGDHSLAKTLALGLVCERLQEQDLTLTGVVSLLSAMQTFTHHDVDQSATEDSANDTSSDDESSARSVSSAHSTSQHDLAPRFARTASFRSRIFAESRAKATLYVGTLPSRNAHGFLLVDQSEFYQHVWNKLLSNSAVAKNGRLGMYITEFVRNLHLNMVPVETPTFVALARAFLAADEPDKLFQFLQHNILADSLELAELLVQSAKTTSRALLQAGLDMYTRLGAITPLVLALLDSGEVDRAVAISWRNMRVNSFDASVIPAALFFDAMVASIWTSRGASSSSSFQIAQRLRKLLLFLRVWDPAALVSDSASSVARTAAEQMPDRLLDPTASRQLRTAFGFPDRA